MRYEGTPRLSPAWPSPPMAGVSSPGATISRFGSGTSRAVANSAISEGVDDRVYDVAISPNGRRVAAGLANKKILLWDVAQGSNSRPMTSRKGACLNYSSPPDGRQLVAGCGQGSVWISSLPAKFPGEPASSASEKPRVKSKVKSKR